MTVDTEGARPGEVIFNPFALTLDAPIPRAAGRAEAKDPMYTGLSWLALFSL